jgi:hypothetical protein
MDVRRIVPLCQIIRNVWEDTVINKIIMQQVTLVIRPLGNAFKHICCEHYKQLPPISTTEQFMVCNLLALKKVARYQTTF